MERSILKLPLSPCALCTVLYSTEHFSRGRKGRKGAERREGKRGGQQRGQKEKRTHENRPEQVSISIKEKEEDWVEV